MCVGTWGGRWGLRSWRTRKSCVHVTLLLCSILVLSCKSTNLFTPQLPVYKSKLQTLMANILGKYFSHCPFCMNSPSFTSVVYVRKTVDFKKCFPVEVIESFGMCVFKNYTTAHLLAIPLEMQKQARVKVENLQTTIRPGNG